MPLSLRIIAVVLAAKDVVFADRLQPEIVAKMLSKIEKKWVADAEAVDEQGADAGDAYDEMRKSCIKVSQAVVTASEGEKDRVTEYMQDVCGSSELDIESVSLCASFANGLTKFMSGDAADNRDNVPLKRFCKVLYKDVAKTAQAEVQAKEKAIADVQAAAAAKKKAEEEAQQKAAEAAAAQKAAEAEAAQKAGERALAKQAKLHEEYAKAATTAVRAARVKDEPKRKMFPKEVFESQPDRYIERLQANTKDAVQKQMDHEEQLQEAYDARLRGAAARGSATGAQTAHH